LRLIKSIAYLIALAKNADGCGHSIRAAAAIAAIAAIAAGVDRLNSKATIIKKGLEALRCV